MFFRILGVPLPLSIEGCTRDNKMKISENNNFVLEYPKPRVILSCVNCLYKPWAYTFS